MDSSPEGADAPNGWARRRGVAHSVQAATLLLPVAAAVTTSAVLSRNLHEPHGLPYRVLWFLLLSGVSTLALWGVDRGTRRLLPLAALLQLSLVFPDRAPSRFHSALRMGSIRRLEEEMEVAQRGGRPGESVDAAALRMIELATAMRIHDRRTRGHMERVRAYADMIGEEMGLSTEDREKLHWGALLHDIGKLEVPESILNKKGKPERDEWEVIRRHPSVGRHLLQPLLAWLGPWANAAWEHHERFDGHGYPVGLAGPEISLAGRIVAVADAFEVMTAARSYKRPMSAADARIELTRCAGSHFDPMVVRALLGVSVGKLRYVMGPLAWAAQVPFLGTGASVSMPAAVSTISRTVVLASAMHAVAPSSVLVTTPADPVPLAAAAGPKPADRTAAVTASADIHGAAPSKAAVAGRPVSTQSHGGSHSHGQDRGHRPVSFTRVRSHHKASAGDRHVSFPVTDPTAGLSGTTGLSGTAGLTGTGASGTVPTEVVGVSGDTGAVAAPGTSGDTGQAPEVISPLTTEPQPQTVTPPPSDPPGGPTSVVPPAASTTTTTAPPTTTTDPPTTTTTDPPMPSPPVTIPSRLPGRHHRPDPTPPTFPSPTTVPAVTTPTTAPAPPTTAPPSTTTTTPDPPSTSSTNPTGRGWPGEPPPVTDPPSVTPSPTSPSPGPQPLPKGWRGHH